MNVDNMTLAITIAASIPDDQRFDMNTWVEDRPDCGMVACMAGHLAMHPEMQARGLYLKPTLVCNSMRVGFNAYAGYAAMAMFFDISVEDSEWLFSSMSYEPNVGPACVAARMNVLLHRHVNETGDQ